MRKAVALVSGGLTLEKLYTAGLNCARTTAMIFAIIIGAEVFSRR